MISIEMKSIAPTQITIQIQFEKILEKLDTQKSSENVNDFRRGQPYYEYENRYDNMIYNRCGRSGLKLPAMSLGMWHNFGSVTSLLGGCGSEPTSEIKEPEVIPVGPESVAPEETEAEAEPEETMKMFLSSFPIIPEICLSVY